MVLERSVFLSTGNFGLPASCEWYLVVPHALIRSTDALS